MTSRFKQDVCRWVIPEQIADPSIISLPMVLRLTWKYLPLQAMLLFRFGTWAYQRRIKGLPYLIQKFIALLYGLEISVALDIGGGLYIPHPYGTTIFVNKMGANCSVVSNVTIGTRTDGRFPTIGNNVYIGAGARVLGGIIVGDHANIGANAVVIKDVPAGATAVGVPAKIIRYHESEEKTPLNF